MRKRDLAILMLSAFAIFFSLQQDGGVSFKDAWMHLTDEYPIKYEAERLPPPLVADLNGDGKKEVLVATHDAKIQILEPHSRRVDEGFSEARVLAEVSLLPDKVRVMSGRRPVAMATGFIDRHRIGQPHKQVLVVVTSGWFVMCFDSNLQKLWENNLQEDFPHNAHHREVSISISNYTLKHGDTGLIIVGGRMEMQPHIFMDPFEEMGMGARFAEQHQRSATEKEASENTGTVDLRHFAFYAFAGRSGVERWSRKTENIEAAASSDASQLIPQHNYKLDVHALNRRQPGEFECREFRESILGVMPHQWDRREDTLLKLVHFKRHKRKTLKKTPGKTINYPFDKPEENHPPGKDSTKKISNIIGKAANFAGSAKSKKGGRIHASIKRTLLYKFQSQIAEGRVYAFENLTVATNNGSYKTTTHPLKLNFQISSKVMPLSSAIVTGSPFKFVPISEICGGSCDDEVLVDVVRMLTGVGSEREYDRHGKTTKLNVIALEADGHKIQCTLFGSYVDELNTFLASGETQNAVVAIQFGKIKTFQDKIHIQNCMSCTKVIFNPTCEEALSLRHRMTGNDDAPSPLNVTPIAAQPVVEPLQEFMYNTPRSTVRGLKDCTKDGTFVVFGTVKHIVGSNNWYYTACVCNKSVYADSGLWFCEKCNRHVKNVTQRFSIKVLVMDDTDSATFVIFDRDATMLFNKTCAEVLEAHDVNAAPGVLPAEISALVKSTYLFKVECKADTSPRFEQSFRVRKICTDGVIINQFKTKWAKEEAIFYRNEWGSLSGLAGDSDDSQAGASALVLSQAGSLSGLAGDSGDSQAGASALVLSEGLETLTASSSKGKELVIDSASLAVSQDLLPKFSSAVVELDEAVTRLGIGGTSDVVIENKGGKRVSPTAEADEDLNLPIKLLKRSIKIEKI